jgi:hypothetical protein
MKMYIIDTTVTPERVIISDDYKTLVKQLETMIFRKLGKSRKEYMKELEGLGHGYDDNESVTFVRAMSEIFNIGVIRQNKLIRCDIASAEVFYKEEYGD